MSGRYLANEVLYYNGEYIKGAALECVEYVMENIAPSHVTGNTHFGRFLNDDSINEFCDSCIKYLEKKITEVNIRHMAYTGVMSKVGFDRRYIKNYGRWKL